MYVKFSMEKLIWQTYGWSSSKSMWPSKPARAPPPWPPASSEWPPPLALFLPLEKMLFRYADSSSVAGWTEKPEAEPCAWYFADQRSSHRASSSVGYCTLIRMSGSASAAAAAAAAARTGSSRRRRELATRDRWWSRAIPRWFGWLINWEVWSVQCGLSRLKLLSIYETMVQELCMTVSRSLCLLTAILLVLDLYLPWVALFHIFPRPTFM